MTIKKWTQKEIEFLKKYYPQKGKMWCAEQLQRKECSIRSKAAKLKLRLDFTSEFFKDFQRRAAQSKIGKKRPDQAIVMKNLHKAGKLINEKWKKKHSERMKTQWKIHPHPKGMLNKHQNEKMKQDMSIRVKKMWADPNSKFNSKAYKQKLSNNSSKRMQKRIQNKGSVYSRANAGWYKMKGKEYFFRSGWEVVYARYLEWLKDNKKIEKWEYEPKCFWFEKIRRGVRSYTPDFQIYNWTGTDEYHEVKGYMDSKSKTKIKRMAKYYPEVTLIVIGKEEYKPIKDIERMFPEAKKFKKK